MSTVRKIAKNTSVVVAGNLTFKIISMFVVIYLARYLGTADFGKYSFVYSYVAFFGTLTDSGIQTTLVREMSRNPLKAPELFGNAYFIKIIFTVVAIILSIITITLMSYPKDTTCFIYISSLTLFFISLSNLYGTVFQTKLKMEFDAIAKIISRIASAGLILWIIYSRGTLYQVILAISFSEIFKTFINYFSAKTLLRSKLEIDFKVWSYLLRESIPLAFFNIIWVFYYQIDIIMLSFLQNDAAVGIYSAACKLNEPIGFIAEAFVISLFPVMSSLFIVSKEKLATVYELSVKYILIIVLPIVVFTTISAHKIVILIYGTQFSSSIFSFQILIWSLLSTSLNCFIGHLLISIGKQKINTLNYLLCATANIVLNFILIPTLSYNGAAIATLITSVLLLLLGFYYASKYFRKLPLHLLLVRPLISCLLPIIFVIKFIEYNILILGILYIFIYFILLLLLHVFSEKDVEIAKKIMTKS